MRRCTFTTVRITCDSEEAERVIVCLRHEGLHPADLAVTTPLALPGARTEYCIQVPADECECARAILKRLSALEVSSV